MRRIAYVLILGALFLAPIKRQDVARLEPVMALAVYRQDGLVVLETDTGSIGRGETVTEAAADMKRSSSKVIYLDTAQMLLVGENAIAQVPELKKHLKGSVSVGPYGGTGVEREAQLLQKKENLPKLRELGR